MFFKTQDILPTVFVYLPLFLPIPILNSCFIFFLPFGYMMITDLAVELSNDFGFFMFENSLFFSHIYLKIKWSIK